jgi:hypothetical protein
MNYEDENIKLDSLFIEANNILSNSSWNVVDTLDKDFILKFSL